MFPAMHFHRCLFVRRNAVRYAWHEPLRRKKKGSLNSPLREWDPGVEQYNWFQHIPRFLGHGFRMYFAHKEKENAIFLFFFKCAYFTFRQILVYFNINR